MDKVINDPAYIEACEEDENFFRDNPDRLHHVRVAKIAELSHIGAIEPGFIQYIIIRRSRKNYYKVLMISNGAAPGPTDTEWNAAYLFQHFAPPEMLKILVKEGRNLARHLPARSVRRSTGALH